MDKKSSQTISPGKSVFSIYVTHVKRHLVLFCTVIAGVIGIQAADIISPLYLRKFFNLLIVNRPSESLMPQLLAILGVIAVISLANWLFRRIHTFSVIYLESRVMADLFSTSFDYLIRHSYRFFISQFTGTLTRRVSKFSTAFESMIDSIMGQFLPTSLFVLGVVTVMFMRNHILGLVLGIWVVCFVSFQLFVAKLRQPLRIARADEDSKMVGALADAISNQTTITLFSGAQYEQGIFRKAVDRWRAATLHSWKADEYIWCVQGFLMVGINLGLLYGAMEYWKQGLLTVGDFVLIQAYLLGMFDRLSNINRELRRFYDAFADATEMAEILEMPHEVKDRAGAKPLKIGKYEIIFKDVDFCFHQTRYILKDFNLVIKNGEKLALVGPSGAGKSTITKLLLRLYDVSGGSVEINGQNIVGVIQDSLRDAISFVPQEPILFHRSLMENIRYGRRGATDEEVTDAAKKAHCHEFISGMSQGYNTYVGERGVKLSGGERQRVAIARAILKNSPILVLDEATSSLDSESEALIQDALQTLMQGKTVVVIAHRLSTIMKMDRIIVLEDGKIVAEGSHADLLKEGGLYQKLWNIQAGNFLDDKER